MDGSVYRLHPTFHNLMVERIRQFVKPGIEFAVVLAEDGSGLGVNNVLIENIFANYVTMFFRQR